MNIIKGVIEFVMEILETIVFVGTLFIIVYLYILQPNQVRGPSMEPTFYSGDYIFTSKVTYKIRPPQRGDVIVFNSPKNPEIEYIKRIIALPGDKIKITYGEVELNGKVISENYISQKTPLWKNSYIKNGQELIIPKNQLFVMGDNRPRSSDSREFGPIPIDSVVGHVFYRYYPANKIGYIENPLPDELRSVELIRILARIKIFSELGHL